MDVGLETPIEARAPGVDAVVAWKINQEIVLLLGSARAILLQFAHPLVAAGVADHSSFSASARSRLHRLHRTLDAMLALTFGADEEAAQAARGINRIHDVVHGRLRDETPIFPSGTPYSAHDPQLLCWVHATVVESALLVYDLCVAPLTQEEKDLYCAEASGIAPLLGIPDGMLPLNTAELCAYMDEMMRGGAIAVTPTARGLAHELLYPPFPRVVDPLLWLVRLTAIGLLPPAIRAAYGYRWDARRERALRLAAWAIRHTMPLMPSIARHWPVARRATRRRQSHQPEYHFDMSTKLDANVRRKDASGTPHGRADG